MSISLLINRKKYQKVLFGLVVSSVLAACSDGPATNKTVDDDKLKNSTPFAYVERNVVGEDQIPSNSFTTKLKNENQSPLELNSPYEFEPGATLLMRSGLDVDAEEFDVLTEYFGSSEYDVKDLNVSADGEWMAFAGHGPATSLKHSTWNIYLFNFESKQVVRVIKDDLLANSGQDTNPTFTLDGQLVFSSDRDAGNPDFPRENIELVGDLCRKVDPEENPSLLHRMSIQGQNIVQLTYGRTNHDINTTTLKDGRIAFVRWDRIEMPATMCSQQGDSDNVSPIGGVAGFPEGLRSPSDWSNETMCAYAIRSDDGQMYIRNEYKILTIDAESLAMEQLYDTVAASSSDEAFLFPEQLFQAENGNLFTLIRHQYNSVMGGDLIELKPTSTPNQDTVFAQIAPDSLTADDVALYPGQFSKNGWYSAYSPYRDGTSRLLVSWAQCAIVKDGVNSFCDSSTTEGVPDVRYGLWVFDPETESQLPIVRARKGKVFSDVAMGQAHRGEHLSLEAFDPDFQDNEDATVIACDFPNNPPVANAGIDQTGYVGDAFAFDGSASSDLDGDPLTYQWSVVTRPEGSLSNLSEPTTAKPTFVPDAQGVYVVQLIVNDSKIDSAPDTATLTISVPANSNPIANAGPDQRVMVGTDVSLNGSASRDPEGQSLTYDWLLVSMPLDSKSELLSLTAVETGFKADVPGVYVVRLMVNDGTYDSVPDTVNIEVMAPPVNNKPIANAGPDQVSQVGQSASLNGAGSSDPEGDALTYRWSLISKPAESQTSLDGANAAQASVLFDYAGSYTAQLIVNDGTQDSDADTVTITVNEPNAVPIANAGPDQTLKVGKSVNLSGSLSSDADGDPLTYKWQLSTRPANSTANLSSADSVSTGFVIDQLGTYVLQLMVNDGKANSAIDTVTVTGKANDKPVANAGGDYIGTLGGTANFDGSASSDIDGDTLTYRWSVTQRPDGSRAELSGADAVSPSFTPDSAGSYTVSLVVNDGELDSDADTAMATVTVSNGTPIADAGPDQSGKQGDLFTLDGSASRDPDGETLTYLWVLTDQPTESTAELVNDETVNPTLEADKVGTYQVMLIVNDGNADSDPDTMAISVGVANHRPTANAGPDQAFKANQTLMLDGSGSNDVDGDSLTYLWTILSPAGSTGLSDATAVSPSITPAANQTYVIQLVVNDGNENSAPDTVELNFDNTKPIADAGENQRAALGAKVTLDGSKSRDVDGDALSYIWSMLSAPQGSNVSLSDSNAVQPTFELEQSGAYVFQLVVSDGFENSEPATVTVNSIDNIAPVANAGPDQVVSVGTTTRLDGRGSSDANEDNLTYRWSLIRRPDNSRTSLSNVNRARPRLEIDQPGEYVAQLIVNDGQVDSVPDTVLINTENMRPVAEAGGSQNVSTGVRVKLDGSGSRDPDGDPLAYRWSLTHKPVNSNVTLVNPQSVDPDFTPDLEGTYIAQLIVNDSALDSTPDTVAIEVTDEPAVCEVSNDKKRTLPVTIRDFKQSHPDFQYRVGVDYGIVANELGIDGKPQYANVGGSTPTTTNEENFSQWYRNVSGVNKNISKTLTMSRDDGSTIWGYRNDSFFPIDGEGFGNSGLTNPDHNYHFTLETHLAFDYKGGETFTFRGDDDLWVFINGKLAIDIGGVHSVIEKRIKLDDIAHELGIEPGSRYTFDLFFAERHTVQSNFMFQTNLDLECVER